MEDSLSLKKKVYLNSYTTLSAESESLIEQIKAFREKMYSTRTQVYGDYPRTHNASDISDKFKQEEHLLCKWEEDYKRAVKRCGEIYCRIENMEDEVEKTVLKMHYLRKMTFEEIAKNSIPLKDRFIGSTSGHWSIFSWNPRMRPLRTRLFFKVLFSAAYTV